MAKAEVRQMLWSLVAPLQLPMFPVLQFPDFNKCHYGSVQLFLIPIFFQNKIDFVLAAKPLAQFSKSSTTSDTYDNFGLTECISDWRAL